MIFNSLSDMASYIVSDGKGILAADESNPTCTKRFDSIGVESTEDNRRDYRELLFRSEGMKGNIGGVILFDETIRQTAADGTLLVDVITSQGSLPAGKEPWLVITSTNKVPSAAVWRIVSSNNITPPMFPFMPSDLKSNSL